MHESQYEAEDVLQELIERHPQMLAGDAAAHGPLVLVRREAGVSDQEDAASRWSLDHLYLDAKGIPTLVEVKRSTDTRARREVVAQVLEYAANARVSFSAELMAEWLEESARRRGSSAADVLQDAFGIDDFDGFWQTVDTNLKAERFRLVFVADHIGPELRRIIEFLNRQMNATEVLAIEVKQYVDPDGAHQTIVPEIVGDTAESRVAKRSGARGEPLDRETLVARLGEQSEKVAEVAERLLEWADQEPRVSTHYTRTRCMIKTGAGALLIKLWVGHEIDRLLEVNFETLAQHGQPWDAERIEQLRKDLTDLGLHFEGNPRGPRASPEPLADDTRRQRFFELMESTLDTLTAA